MTKLSIITINYNNASGLKKTIESVVHQTYSDFEYIVIDGASSDESLEIIKSFDNQIDYWVSEPDTGIYNAMNKGIKQANGEYFLFLNSGDYLYQNTSVQDLMGENPEGDIVYTNQYRFSEKRERIKRFPDQLTFYWLYTQYLPHNCMLIKRSLFETVGYYDEEYKIISDWLFYLLAIAKYNCSYQYIDMIFAAMEDGGISNASEFRMDVRKERDAAVKKNFPLFYEDFKEFYESKHNTLFKKTKRLLKRLLFIQK